MTDFTRADVEATREPGRLLDEVPTIVGVTSFDRQFDAQTRRMTNGEDVVVDHDVVIDVEVDALPEPRAASLILWVGNVAVSHSGPKPDGNVLRYVESDPSRLEAGAPLTLRWELGSDPIPPIPTKVAPTLPPR